MGILKDTSDLDRMVLEEYIRETFNFVNCYWDDAELYYWSITDPKMLLLCNGRLYVELIPNKPPVFKWKLLQPKPTPWIPIPASISIRTPRDLDNFIDWLTVQDWESAKPNHLSTYQSPRKSFI